MVDLDGLDLGLTAAVSRGDLKMVLVRQQRIFQPVSPVSVELSDPF